MNTLRDVAITFFGWLGGECLAAAATLAGLNMDAPSALGGQAMRDAELLRNVREHPCPECQGTCVLTTPAGSLGLCPACRGYGVDVQWLAQTAVQ